MWLSLCFYIIFSVIIISILHYLFNYCKDNFTTKKTKDMVNIEIEKYKTIIEELENHKNISIPENNATNDETDLFEFAQKCITENNI